ncbi:MAG: type I-B CRISPR-associated protein Cas5b [Candidatus Lokiarchaeota archaeon]|nr:type I-B CRISPR-associated protein Cas5b [Candidatus Harpocratesius repetitus]
MKLLHVEIKALTASFRLPFALSGSQVTVQVPMYPTILGLISCCAGRPISSQETDIGFIFTHQGTGLDLERFIRWSMNKNKPKLNTKGAGIRKREYLINPHLDLFLSNLSFKKYFESPVGIPVLGRSQDVAWIEKVSVVDVQAVKEGNIQGSLIPMSLFGKRTPIGFILRLPEEIKYDQQKRLREISSSNVFVVIPSERNHLTHIELDSGLFSIKNEKSHMISDEKTKEKVENSQDLEQNLPLKTFYLHHFN